MRPHVTRRLVAAGILAFILLLVGLGVVHQHRHHISGPPTAMFSVRDGAVVVVDDSPLMKRLHVEPVRSRVAPHDINVPGLVQALPTRTVNILSPVTGLVVQADIHPGQFVHRGDILAILASGDFDQVYADLNKAKSQEAYQERVVRRAQEVLSVGGNSAKELDSARNDLAQAQIERQRAAWRLQALNAHPELAAQGKVPLIAPVDGSVSTANIAQGENITDTSATQITLLDLSQVQVNAEIPENAIADVHLGETATARFDALAGASCTAPVDAIEPVLQADTRRMVARITCPNSGADLHPNMFATVAIAVSQPSMPIVPKSALLMNNDRLTVFVEEAPLHYRRRTVVVGYDEGDDVRVLSGLKAGERIVSRGAILLNDDD